MPKPTQTPFDAVRDAFARLDASEKTAFVLEATFAAVGQGLSETGRRFADTIQDIDGLFTEDRRSPDTPAAPSAETPTATRPKPTGGTSPGDTADAPKTAGKSARKPKDGDA